MQKRSIAILCIALTGGLTASAGSLGAGMQAGISLIPLPELTSLFSDDHFQPGNDAVAAARFQRPNGFIGLSTTTPNPAWADGLADKLSSLEPAPFAGDSAAPGANQSGVMGALYGVRGTGSLHETESSRIKTTAIPLPTAGLLAVAGIGVISAGRRRAQVA